MKTPIYDFLKNYASTDISRLHMPGHKGNMQKYCPELAAAAQYDITEIMGADELYLSEGIIAEAEDNLARLYGAKCSCFSAGGSTLCIQAMLRLAAGEGDEIIASRNVHGAFVNACALLGITAHFVLPQFNDRFFVSGEVKASEIEKALLEHPSARAVYITSPDYLGCISDVKAIAKVCDRYGKPLLVDNAHGAHLKFLGEDMHPITLGAAMCCDSAHKTLPAFTGGAYLHVSSRAKMARELDKGTVKEAMSLFGSTSPSYLIMLSLDLCNRYLAANAKEDFVRLEAEVNKIYRIASKKGFLPICERMDITKLTLDAYSVGFTGEELAAHFRAAKIEPEYVAERHVVLMLSPQNSENDLSRLYTAIDELVPKEPIFDEELRCHIGERAMSIREAAFSKRRLAKTDSAIGCIAAESVVKCPPGVPIIIPGEIIDETIQKLLKKTRILSLYVVE